MRDLKFIFIMTGLLVLTSCSFDLNNQENSEIEVYQKGKIVKLLPYKQVVLIGGCFDVLHYGHMDYLRKAKSQGNYLIVALEPDERIIKYKKRLPIHTQEQRAKNLASIRYVDKVLLLPVLSRFDDYNQLVQDVHPTIIAVTSGDPQLKNKQRQALQVGAKVEIVNDGVGSFSSRKIIQSLSY